MLFLLAAQDGMEHHFIIFMKRIRIFLFTTKNSVCFFSDEIKILAQQRSKIINDYYQMRLDDLTASKKPIQKIFTILKPAKFALILMILAYLKF